MYFNIEITMITWKATGSVAKRLKVRIQGFLFLTPSSGFRNFNASVTGSSRKTEKKRFSWDYLEYFFLYFCFATESWSRIRIKKPGSEYIHSLGSHGSVCYKHVSTVLHWKQNSYITTLFQGPIDNFYFSYLAYLY